MQAKQTIFEDKPQGFALQRPLKYQGFLVCLGKIDELRSLCTPHVFYWIRTTHSEKCARHILKETVADAKFSFRIFSHQEGIFYFHFNCDTKNE